MHLAELHNSRAEGRREGSSTRGLDENPGSRFKLYDELNGLCE
jgi:hypothetical protein